MNTTWQYLATEELKNLPSVINATFDNGKGPITLSQEAQYRKVTCAFIQEAGVRCKIPQLTIATALVFFHRFYAFHRFQDYDRFQVATTCIFLSTKVEETPVKLEVVIRASYAVYQKKDLDIEGDEYKQIREKVLQMERLLLQTIGFDMKVEHPYKHLLQYMKKINGEKKLAQTAWNFVNDSLRTTLCLQYPPDKIAAAAIYLASRYLESPLPSQPDPQSIFRTDQTTVDGK
jgi:cyclin T